MIRDVYGNLEKLENVEKFRTPFPRTVCKNKFMFFFSNRINRLGRIFKRFLQISFDGCEDVDVETPKAVENANIFGSPEL